MADAVQTTRSGTYTLVSFPASWLRLGAIPVTGGILPLSTKGAMEVFPTASVLVNGPMISYCADTPHTYEGYQCGKPDGMMFDQASGLRFDSPSPNEGITLASVRRGLLGPVVAVASPGGAIPDGAITAFQLAFALVRGGQVADNLDHGNLVEVVWRTGVGATQDGARVVVAVGTGSTGQLAAALRDAGAWDAGYLDGSNSSHVVVRPGTLAGPSNDRRTPSWILAVAPTAKTRGPGGVATPDVALIRTASSDTATLTPADRTPGPPARGVVPTWAWVLGGAALLGAGGVGAWVWHRRRPKASRKPLPAKRR